MALIMYIDLRQLCTVQIHTIVTWTLDKATPVYFNKMEE